MLHLKCLLLLLLFASCTTTKKPHEKIQLEKTTFKELQNWKEDNHLLALETFKKSCGKIKNIQISKKLPLAEFGASVSKWQDVCRKAINVGQAEARSYFEQNFTPFKVTNHHHKGLFTGYYEASLRGSLRKYGKYKHSIYKKPIDLELHKYQLSRAAINNNALHGRNLEIAYVDDEIELFFMHIQGSGHIFLDDGKEIRVGFAGQNGHPYFAIGRHLVDNYKIDSKVMSAEFIKTWLRNNPRNAKSVMELNPSYIFFHQNNTDGAVGAQGIVLTKERSLAVDRRYFPLGAPLWLETTYPNQSRFHKLVIAQDTGGAIKGPIRGDIFFGTGKEARILASGMKNMGKYYLLLPR